MKDYELAVENADGPIQLCLMDQKLGVGRRLLGAKGAPEKDLIVKWDLSRKELEQLVEHIQEVLDQDRVEGEK